MYRNQKFHSYDNDIPNVLLNSPISFANFTTAKNAFALFTIRFVEHG